jgi:hypothetical protein
MNTVDTLREIYNRFRKKYRGNPDSDQMCCMWSISNPPKDIYNSDQILTIENKFDIEISEKDAYAIYDMDIDEAIEKINAIKMAQC